MQKGLSVVSPQILRLSSLKGLKPLPFSKALLKACRDDESSAEDWIPAHVLDGEFGVYDIASQQLWEVLFHDVGFGA